MAGCYGNDSEDRARERQLDKHLDGEFEPVECEECGYTFETAELDDDGLCAECAKQKGNDDEEA
jgi:predicted Zn-ribbon and HTH transcriptional regulator